MKKVGNRSYYSCVVALFLTMATVLSSFAQEAEAKGDAVQGKSLFNANCAACHTLDKRLVGPPLSGVAEKRSREWLQKWIRNSADLIKSGNKDAIAIYEEYNKIPMTPFPQLSDQEIDDILAYTSAPVVQEEDAVQEEEVAAPVSTVVDKTLLYRLMLAGFVVVLAALIVMFVSVNRALRDIAEANGVSLKSLEKSGKYPIWNVIVKNQFVILFVVVFLLLSSAYFVYGYLMQIGVDQGYEPIQPIHYSHKIHAGDNKINCKFCHSAARSSKTAGIPSLNVCMNCHKNISEYKGAEDKKNGYTRAFYTAEIQKLYEAVGWDPDKRQYSGVQKPVRWVRIHNLPDFAYFNHSQHITVAGVECQTCHGPVEEMEIVHQHSLLTMGWCVNCHRKTNVNSENPYYEKIHQQLAKKKGVEKLTIAQMGGLECGKCHY